MNGSRYSRRASLSLHTGSMMIWALYPVWANIFGFSQAIWLSAGLGLTLNGVTLLAFARFWGSETFLDKDMWRTVRQALAKRKRALLPIAGVIVEDVSVLAALRLIDPTVAQSILRFYPVTFAFWAWHSAKDRFSLSKAAFAGLSVACLGAALVVLSAAEAEFGGGWHLAGGIGLVTLAVAAISTKSQELALLADVGRRRGWAAGDLRREQTLSVALWGIRNLAAGAPVLLIALPLTGAMPASFWWGNIIFGAILGPAAIILGRCAILLHSDLGLSSVRSAGVLATLGFAQLLGGITVANAWLLAGGAACISLGSFITLTRYRPKLLARRFRH